MGRKEAMNLIGQDAEFGCRSDGDETSNALERDDSFKFKSGAGMTLGWVLVLATSTSDVITKLGFQMLNKAEDEGNIEFGPVNPTVAVIIAFVVSVVGLALPAMIIRIIFTGGLPESAHQVSVLMWPFLGIVMLTQILMAAVTFVFLPAAVVSALNNGLSIMFAALVRLCRGKRKYPCAAWLALAVVVLGCSLVGVENYYNSTRLSSEGAHGELTTRHLIGLTCVTALALSLALAGTLDDYLTKDKKMESDFLASAQASSAAIYVFCGIGAWMWNTGHRPADVIRSVGMTLEIPWFKLVMVLCIVAQATLKVVAVFTVAHSSAVTAQMFLAVSMCSTWFGSAALHWMFDDQEGIGDTCTSWGATIRAIGMSTIIVGILWFLDVIPNCCRNCFCCQSESDECSELSDFDSASGHSDRQ